MNHIKYFIIFLLLVGITQNGKCGEFASWWQKTRYGNEICNEKCIDVYQIGIKCRDYKVKGTDKCGHIVSNLKKWYFYKSKVVGEFTNSDKTNYFIFDEVSCEILIFKDLLLYKNKLEELNLNPKIWTRWYESNWGEIFTSGDFAEDLDFIFFKFPVLIFVSICVAIGLVRTKFNLKHKFNVISLIITTIILGRILLDLWPNSF